jgi:hypothetical protein
MVFAKRKRSFLREALSILRQHAPVPFLWRNYTRPERIAPERMIFGRKKIGIHPRGKN